MAYSSLIKIETKIKIRIILFCILFLLISWLLYMGLVPSGKIEYTKYFDRNNSFISDLKPSARLGDIQNGIQKVTANPIYFSLRTPRKFDKAKLGFYFKSDHLQDPIIESGVLVDSTLWRYDLKPLQNKLVDDFCATRNVFFSNNILFCQTANNYPTVNDYLNSATSSDSLALYNYKMEKKFNIADYSPSTKELIIDNDLRGDFQFYTYIKSETMNFDFVFKDLNSNKDEDRIDLNLYYDDILIDTKHLDDDDNKSDDKRVSLDRKLSLLVPNLPEGVYKIELRVNDDIVTTQINTKQKILSFANKIRFADDNSQNTELITDSDTIEAITTNPQSLQNIEVDKTTFDLNATFKQISYKFPQKNIDTNYHLIRLKKNDVTISGNGVFAFNNDSLLNPSYKKFDTNMDMASTTISYLLANYKLPDDIDGWKYAEIEVDLTKAYRENRTYSFIVSIPGLVLDKASDNYLEIKKIDIALEGKNLINLIKGKLK